MRGDNGALPRLTIELTDSGYRAVDPELKVRYVVSEAPPGMPLTDGARTLLSTNPPPVQSAPPPPAAPNPIPTLASPPAPAPSVEPAPVATAPVAAPAPDAAPGASSAVATAPTPSAPLPPAASAPPPAVTPSVVPAVTSSVPPALAVQVIRQREEKPSPASPIAYRELALAVKAGTPKPEIETLLRARLDELSGTMPADTRRYVQIAVFDHVFVKRPVRPPLGVLLWKDWRGDPTLSFPGFGEADEAPPPSSLSTARTPSWSATTSIAPRSPSQIAEAPAVSMPAPAAPAEVPAVAAPPEAPSVPPPVASSAEPRPASLMPSRVVSVGPSKPPPPETPKVTAEPPPATPESPVAAPAVATPSESSPAAAAPPDVPAAAHAPEADVALRSEPSHRRSEPPSRPSDPPGRRSDPGAAPPRRRSPGEDLITELFDRMGDLMFMGDIPSGADYVLNVLFDLIPCEAMLVHVFDLARREFVVVRAHGPSMRKALLFRTPDTDPVVTSVMRQRSVVSNGAAPVHSAAFDRLGVQAKQILSGAARQGGRYLGLIEIANPVGGAPFHDGEKHALEYVCEQFAEFVASRPLVLDEDIVLRA
ncbi:MAG TPA: hypothetical protein VMI54_29025 [Polyangiaceae bacterium]|nr:hypothetical protein [Polyangiaceae bacterium]